MRKYLQVRLLQHASRSVLLSCVLIEICILGAIVHPAHLDDDAAFDKLKKPLYASLAGTFGLAFLPPAGDARSHSSPTICPIEQDRHFGPERRNTLMASLTKLSTPEAPDGMSGEVAGTSGYDYMVQVFSGVMHGFGTRGDMSIERNRWAKETSAKACRDWYVHFERNRKLRDEPPLIIHVDCRFDRFLV